MQNRCTAPLQCCQNCRSLCDDEFKQVVNLKKSGLLIFMHNKDSLQERNIENKRSIILYNPGHKDLKRFDYIAELCQYKTKCFKCKALIQYIRCLIDNISTISKNEVLGICGYCKRLPKKNKCKRCEYLMYKFLNNEMKRDLENKIRFNELICTMRQVLLSITQGQIICKHNVYLDSESKMQLDNQLKHLNWPVTPRQLNIDGLLDFLDEQKIGSEIIRESEKIRDLITKIKSFQSYKDSTIEDDLASSESRTACICKYVLNNKITKTSSFDKYLITEDSPTLLETKKNVDIKLKSSSEKLQKSLKLTTASNTKPNIPHAYPTLKQINTKAFSNDKRNDNKYNVGLKNKNENVKKQKEKNIKLFSDQENELILEMMKQRKKIKDEMKRKSKSKKNEEPSRMLDLPHVIEKLKEKKEIESEKSESFVECELEHPIHVFEMIKGTNIVPYHHRHTRECRNTEKIVPILFKTREDDFKLPDLNNQKHIFAHSDAMESNTGKSKRKSSRPDEPGIILYQLSNREFIDKGWTILPTTKVMRKMNIYKMIPSYIKFNWFKNHKDQKMLFYDSTEKLAEIYENGCGKWFYKNGNLALEYYSAAEMNSGKRCVIYSSYDEMDLKKKTSLNILACFDYLGNGVVYDNNGNVRIKYNQSEGLIVDKKIGPPGRWKWHTLNDPPVLYPVFINTFVKESSNKDLEYDENIIKQNDEMIGIELDNLRREKAAKILQEYKSFQIRIKVVKINDHFTLRIINQAKIYLQFRYEHICLKLNLGMLLINEEIIDTDVAEVSQVSTPYDYPKKIEEQNRIYF